MGMLKADRYTKQMTNGIKFSASSSTFRLLVCKYDRPIQLVPCQEWTI